MHGQKLVIYEDNGVGIDKNNANKIFALFTTSHGSNMELGLPFSKSSMSHFGGSICYDNNEEGKFRFILTFK